MKYENSHLPEQKRSRGWFGTLLIVLLFTAETSHALVSDDFDTGELDTALWSFVNPLADGEVSLNGTQALITVPAGTSHNVWSAGNFAPRLMQPTTNTDFEIEVKFESALAAEYQMQGLLAEQDAGNFVRIEFYSDSTTIRAFSAMFVDGNPTVMSNVPLSVSGETLYMRVGRQGDQWTQSYSEDGVNWQTASTFTHVLAVSAVGVYAGNAGVNTPAHTAVVDYFFNTAAPIVPEDGQTLHDLTVNVSGSGSVLKNPDQPSYQPGAVVELTAVPSAGWTFEGWNVDGAAAGSANPTTVTLDADRVVEASFVQGQAVQFLLEVTTAGAGQVVLDPPGGVYTEGTTVELTAVADAGWYFSDWSGELAGTQNPVTLVVTADAAATATFQTDTSAPVIDSIQVSAGQTTATVSWSTDEPTIGEVAYGESLSYELGVVEDTALLQNHAVTLTGLSSGVTYHLQITATDNAGNVTISSDVALATTLNPSAIQSDDFSSGVLNSALWTFVDPLGDGTVSVNSTQALISVPAGTSHDVWSAGNFAPRLMQPSADTDFEVEVKFESPLSEEYQIQGVVIEQDADNFVRLDFYSDGTSTRAFAAVFVGGSPSVMSDGPLSLSGGALYLRVTRQGDQWTQSYSEDGVNWQTASTFTHVLAVSAVGVYAGNAGVNTPAHTAVVDYFFNTAAPIVPEDGQTLHDLTVNVSGSGSVLKNPDQPSYQPGAVVELTAVPSAGWTFEGWNVDGAAAGSANPTTVTLDADRVVEASFVQGQAVQFLLEVTTAGAGQVVLDPPGGVYTEGTTVELTAVADAGWYFSDWSGELAGTQNPVTLVVTADAAATATFQTDTSAPVIDSIQVSAGQTTATVSWSTDEPTIGEVAYGESLSYELGVVEDTALLQNHAVTLTGLSSGVTYHLQITATDNAGNVTISSDVALATTLNPSAIQSDDFSSGVLNSALWTFVDPLGDGTVSVNSTQALISVPAGTSHDVWSAGNFAPRLMQPSADTDFEVEVKFESPLSEEYQIQGVVIEQDADNFVRLDFYSDGTSTRAFAAVFVGGSPSVMSDGPLSLSGGALYLRVTRQGDQWTQSYSEDGVNWQTASTFTHVLAVSAVGVYAGNAGVNTPAHTAVVDYFFNTAAPIVPEDGQTLHDLTVNVSGSGSVLKNPDQPSYQPGAVVELTAVPSAGWTFEGWNVDGAAAGSANPTTVTLDADRVVEASFVQGQAVQFLLEVTTAGAGQVVLDPPGGVYTEGTTVELTAVADAGWYFSDWSGELAGTQNPATLIVTADATVTANFDIVSIPGDGPEIDIFYGTEQVFGVGGLGQPWINILGNVTDPDDLASVTYSLNGDTETFLSLGWDQYRLDVDGDFNADIPSGDFAEGENTVAIRALDLQGNESLSLVTVNFTENVVPTLPYTIDWNDQTSIQDVAQIVDGDWIIEGGTVRNAEMGYDRLIAIGDYSWTDYEATVHLTINQVEPYYEPPSWGPAVGLVARWAGHVGDGEQPAVQWWPLGVFAYYRPYEEGAAENFLLGDPGKLLDSSWENQPTLSTGVEYIFKIRIETLPDGSSHYMFKRWRATDIEPNEWLLQGIEAPGTDVPSGSLLIVAHHMDVSIGQVSIVPIAP